MLGIAEQNLYIILHHIYNEISMKCVPSSAGHKNKEKFFYIICLNGEILMKAAKSAKQWNVMHTLMLCANNLIKKMALDTLNGTIFKSYPEYYLPINSDPYDNKIDKQKTK